MTPNEIIEFIENEVQIDVRFCDNEKVNKTIEVLKFAIQLIKKQIPKKPDLEGDWYDNNDNLIYDTWICPCCEEHYEVDYDIYNHCPKCGQAIDRGDME